MFLENKFVWCKTMRIISISIAFLFLFAVEASSCIASEESPSIFNEFKIASKGYGYSGPISVTGSGTEKGLSNLNVNAFNKHFSLNSDELMKLSGLMVNNIQISMDGGYGGRKFIIVLSTSYAAGTVKSGYVEVSEDGIKVNGLK